MVSNKKKNKTVFLKRSRVLIYLVIFLIIVIMGRFIQIQIFERDRYTSMMNNQVLGVDKKIGERGTIYDNQGHKLAFNRGSYILFVDPSLLNDDRVSEKLEKDINLLIKSKILKLNKNTLKEIKALAKEGKKYKVLAKDVDEDKKKKIITMLQKNYKLSSKKKYKLLLGFEKTVKRMYFHNREYEKTIGLYRFTDNSRDKKIGISGLEKKYEKYLTEKKRMLSKLYSLNKRNVLALSKETVYLDINGKNLHLTINSDINFILNEEIKRQFLETNAREAYGIVMDPNNGKILGVSAFSKNKNLIRNNLFQSQYEPGSIFKPLIMAAGLNEKYFSKNAHFDVGDGTILKYGKIIKESSRSTKGIISATEVIKKSSNVGMVLVSDYFSDKIFEDYLKKYGLYEKTNVDFPGELKPYTVPYKKWDRLKKNTMAFGQGIAVTPIQMITAFSTVINGGILYRPYLVDKITNSNGITVMRNLPTKIRRVISEDVSKTLREMLEETVADGTGKRAYVDGYRLGGKTGTAQLSNGHGYEKHQYLASFVGFFPADKPKYIIMAMFMRPQADVLYKKFGGYVAAPVVGNIARRIIKQEELYSKKVSKINNKDIKNIDFRNKIIDENSETMPDLKGVSPKEVIELFEDKDVEIVGEGLVDRQYPEAGTNIDDITKIKIFLK